MNVPDPREQPVMRLWPEVGPLLGLKRSASFDAYHRGELPFPCWKIGAVVVCPTAKVLEALGLRPTRQGKQPAAKPQLAVLEGGEHATGG